MNHLPSTTRATASGRLELVIAWVLRVGVVVSSITMGVGGLVTLISSSTRHAATKTVSDLRRGALHPSGLEVPHSVSTVLSGVGHGYGPAIAMLGVLLLIATPVVRVAVGAVGFAIDRDWTYVIITLCVLTVLVASFAIGG